VVCSGRNRPQSWKDPFCVPFIAGRRCPVQQSDRVGKVWSVSALTEYPVTLGEGRPETAVLGFDEAMKAAAWLDRSDRRWQLWGRPVDLAPRD